MKEYESVTNHDVKAVEYFLKHVFESNQELSEISEFVHFGCTSEDINNLAYALMIKEAIDEHVLSLNDILPELTGCSLGDSLDGTDYQGCG